MFAPIFAPASMCGPISFSFAVGDAGYFALVKTTFGPSQQPSSSTENSGTNTLECSRTPSTDPHVVLDVASRADTDVVADLVVLTDQHAVAGTEISADSCCLRRSPSGS